jgi:hypothetical protein
MNARELISEQRRAVLELLSAVDRTPREDMRRLIELSENLAAYIRIEEEILFPLVCTSPACVDDSWSAAGQVLRHLSTLEDSNPSHAKLALVIELAAEYLEYFDSSHRDPKRFDVDHEMVEEIGESLATIFENGVSFAFQRASQVGDSEIDIDGKRGASDRVQ